MNVSQAKAALAGHQTSFQEVVKQPNTLERNLVLAEHRTEISKLQKLIAKSAQA